MGITDMLEQKSVTKQISKLANVKPKLFYAKVEEKFDFVDEGVVPKVAAKALLYSRIVEIEKIAEIVGGKDERSIKCLDAYLERCDFTKMNVEHSLRGFLQTFRMANVDS